MSDYPRRDKRARLNHGVDAKIVIMGNTGVGKTSLLHRYTQNRFDPKNTTSTTGAFFVTKKIDVNGLKVRLQLWDTAGQERFRSMAPMYYRGANAALLLYDITNMNSFQDIKGWLEELKGNCDPGLIIYIVGAKADLHDQRQVTSDLARLSLHNWFPPPKPPPRPPTPPSTFSYMRPRFTSFTSLRSLHSNPDELPPTTTSASLGSPLETASSSAPAQLTRGRSGSSGALLQRSASPPRGTQRNRAVTSTPASPPPSAVPLARAHSASAQAAMSPSRLARVAAATAASAARGTEFPSDNHSRSSGEVDDGYGTDDGSFGLGSGMELFEASSKDGAGIEHLFDSLIDAIIARRDVIEAENALRQRDSVVLSANTPAWAIQADREAAAEKARSARGGWSCCSI